MMKSITAYLCIALALALAGAVLLGLSRVDRDIAHAQQSVSTLKYAEADEAYAGVERYFEYGSRLPWIGHAPVNDIRARRAQLRYWQGQYGALTSQQPDPVGAVPEDNVGLRLVTANALYRSGRIQAKDKQAILKVVESGIQAYLTVLKTASHPQDAAYNYEFLVRLREDILQGRGNPKLPAGTNDSNGLVGIIFERGDASGFRPYVPLDKEERDKTGGPAKVAPIKRKG
jgi:hypothetical protein